MNIAFGPSASVFHRYKTMRRLIQPFALIGDNDVVAVIIVVIVVVVVAFPRRRHISI